MTALLAAMAPTASDWQYGALPQQRGHPGFQSGRRAQVKVGKIKFTGNHAFSDRKLVRAMRHDRPYAIPLYFWYIPVLTKTYDREKLNEDLEVVSAVCIRTMATSKWL